MDGEAGTWMAACGEGSSCGACSHIGTHIRHFRLCHHRVVLGASCDALIV